MADAFNVNGVLTGYISSNLADISGGIGTVVIGGGNIPANPRDVINVPNPTIPDIPTNPPINISEIQKQQIGNNGSTSQSTVPAGNSGSGNQSTVPVGNGGSSQSTVPAGNGGSQETLPNGTTIAVLLNINNIATMGKPTVTI